MQVEQFVMAYQADQDRLRALLPAGYDSLRPVLRINAEIRGGPTGTLYLELNTPVAAQGRRGWLNIGRWHTPADPLTCQRRGEAVTFRLPFLTITYTKTGAVGGCPAERDNEGCFYRQGKETVFVPAETIQSDRTFCGCTFRWSFTPADAQGASQGDKTLPAAPTPPQVHYPRQELSPQTAAAIPCRQVLGAYAVTFLREA